MGSVHIATKQDSNSILITLAADAVERYHIKFIINGGKKIMWLIMWADRSAIVR